MPVHDSLLDLVGDTPLVRLRRLTADLSATVLVKVEYLNPGGSVKDRAALYIIKDAEERGLLRPGGVIVEGTAGNTGIGLALVGNARGYHTVIVMPETQSQEKKDMLRLCGADLRLVPAVPLANPMHYTKYSGRLAEEIAGTAPNGAIWANQFDNLANRRGHYETTGPEIWRQTEGKVDGFVCAVGTGGTLSGVGIALKQRNPSIKIYLSDCMGSGIFSWYDRREFKPEGNSITEGIGNNRETENLKGFAPDGQYRITDEEMLPILFQLVQEEGLVLGGSTGINVAGAIRLAKELGPGKTIVTILADSGSRYQSKLFNPAFLKEKNLPSPPWLGEAGA
jgi:cysteine synthase A